MLWFGPHLGIIVGFHFASQIRGRWETTHIETRLPTVICHWVDMIYRNMIYRNIKWRTALSTRKFSAVFRHFKTLMNAVSYQISFL